MEVALIAPTSMRIKGKQSTFLVDPVSTKGKLQADASINLLPSTVTPDIEGLRITLQGPGEYEVSGVKITALGTSEKTQYYLTVDNVRLLLTKASSLKGKDFREIDMLVLYADELPDQAIVAETGVAVALFYGEKAQEALTILGKTSEPVTKYIITKDKLPSEMEVVLVG